MVIKPDTYSRCHDVSMLRYNYDNNYKTKKRINEQNKSYIKKKDKKKKKKRTWDNLSAKVCGKYLIKGHKVQYVVQDVTMATIV